MKPCGNNSVVSTVGCCGSSRALATEERDMPPRLVAALSESSAKLHTCEFLTTCLSNTFDSALASRTSARATLAHDSASALCPLANRRSSPWRTENSAVQPSLCSQIGAEMDTAYRRYRCCEYSLTIQWLVDMCADDCYGYCSTVRVASNNPISFAPVQLWTSTAPGSIDGARRALDWSAFEYSHGEHQLQRPELSQFTFVRSWDGRAAWAIPPGVYYNAALPRSSTKSGALV
jgi:hypothetical protein